MKQTISVILLCLLATMGLAAEDMAKAKDGSGIYGYKDTPKQPWSQWLVHDPDRPVPRRVDPGKAPSPVAPPSDAIVLFDGTDVSKWQTLGDWKKENGCLIAGNTQLTTKETFGEIQLHVEFMGPVGFEGPWYNKGNNGVTLGAVRGADLRFF